MYAAQKPGEPPQFCTVFNHMVKSGGTSIKEQMVQSSQREGDAEPGKRGVNQLVPHTAAPFLHTSVIQSSDIAPFGGSKREGDAEPGALHAEQLVPHVVAEVRVSIQYQGRVD